MNKCEVSDKIENFSRKFDMSLNEMRTKTLQLVQQSSRNQVYTDGSVNESRGKEIGIFNSQQFSISLKVERSYSIMSVKMNAVNHAFNNLDSNGSINNEILSDSKSFCSLLCRANEREENEVAVQNILELMHKTSTRIQLIPGHVS